jgi:hypothetical protein
MVDTRMPCQGTAHVQQSHATEEAIDLERGAAQSVCLVKSCVDDHMHIRSDPQIA